jgi:nitroreductase
MTTTVDPQTIAHVVWAAALAPSIHNTQPWRFVTGGDQLDLYADRSRQLAVLDPTGRQLHVSCGGALEHARVAARSLGIDAGWELLPDPADPDHLACLTLRPGPAASAAELAMAEAALKRHTYRGRFQQLPVSPAVLDLLREAVEHEEAALRLVTSPDELVELEVLLSRADAEELKDPEYVAELAHWTAPQEGGGIPSTSLDPAVGAGSSLQLRRFGDGPASAAPLVVDPPAVDHPSVAVLVTQADTARDWLVAGQALSALLLVAAEHDVLAQPLGQLTDKNSYRNRLSHALGIVGSPQLALRLGHAPSPPPSTPRRSVSEIRDDHTTTGGERMRG